MTELTSHKFDMALVDGYELNTCMFLIPHVLGIRHAYMCSFFPPMSFRMAQLPSYQTTHLADFIYPQTLLQKLENILQHMTYHRDFSLATSSSLLEEFAPGVSSIWDII